MTVDIEIIEKRIANLEGVIRKNENCLKVCDDYGLKADTIALNCELEARRQQLRIMKFQMKQAQCEDCEDYVEDGEFKGCSKPCGEECVVG